MCFLKKAPSKSRNLKEDYVIMKEVVSLVTFDNRYIFFRTRWQYSEKSQIVRMLIRTIFATAALIG